MPRSVGDDRLDVLVDEAANVAEKYATLLAEMPFQEFSRRQQIYIKILELLADFRAFTEVWSAESFGEILSESNSEILSMLGQEILSNDPDNILLAVTESASENLATEIRRAISAMLTQASQLLHLGDGGGLLPANFRSNLVLGKLKDAQISQERVNLQQKIRDGGVLLNDVNGKGRRFSLDYFAAMAATYVLFSTKSQLTLERTRELNYDLVMVSPQPSTIGDFCDAYRGRVFSISGAHPTYPPLSSIPGGGCPMHRHCHHWLQPFDGTSEFAPLDPQFLDLADSGADVNEIQALWEGMSDG